MSSRTKKQHFVPQFYLQRFSTNGKSLWVFDRGQGKLYPTNIKDACSKKDLYESPISRSLVVENPFIFPNEIESQLSREEANYASMLSNLLKNDPGAHIPKAEQEDLAIFIAHLIGRNAYTLNTFIPANPSELLDHDNEYRALLEDIGLGSIIPALYDQAAKRALVKWRHAGTLQQTIIEDLHKLHLTMLQAPSNTELVTSSFPALMTIKSNNGQRDRLTCLYLPLSQERAALFHQMSYPQTIRLNLADVDALSRQYISPYHFGNKVIGASKKALQHALITAPSICYDRSYPE